jgi:hypothetical protein
MTGLSSAEPGLPIDWPPAGGPERASGVLARQPEGHGN